MTVIPTKKEKMQKQMDLVNQKFEDILRYEINSFFENAKDINYSFTKWLEIKLNYIIKAYIVKGKEKERIKAFVNNKVDGILNSKKYNIVVRDTVTNQILCAINIQKIFYNINNNLYNVFKDTVFNATSLEGRNIPLYTLIVLPKYGYARSNIGEFGEKELCGKDNIYRLLNFNGYSKMSQVKLLLLDNNIKELPITEEVQILTTLSDIISYKSQSAESTDAFEKKVIIKNLNNIFSDIYTFITNTVAS